MAARVVGRFRDLYGTYTLFSAAAEKRLQHYLLKVDMGKNAWGPRFFLVSSFVVESLGSDFLPAVATACKKQLDIQQVPLSPARMLDTLCDLVVWRLRDADISRYDISRNVDIPGESAEISDVFELMSCSMLRGLGRAMLVEAETPTDSKHYGSVKAEVEEEIARLLRPSKSTGKAPFDLKLFKLKRSTASRPHYLEDVGLHKSAMLPASVYFIARKYPEGGEGRAALYVLYVAKIEDVVWRSLAMRPVLTLGWPDRKRVIEHRELLERVVSILSEKLKRHVQEPLVRSRPVVTLPSGEPPRLFDRSRGRSAGEMGEVTEIGPLTVDFILECRKSFLEPFVAYPVIVMPYYVDRATGVVRKLRFLRGVAVESGGRPVVATIIRDFFPGAWPGRGLYVENGVLLSDGRIVEELKKGVAAVEFLPETDRMLKKKAMEAIPAWKHVHDSLLRSRYVHDG